MAARISVYLWNEVNQTWVKHYTQPDSNLTTYWDNTTWIGLPRGVNGVSIWAILWSVLLLLAIWVGLALRYHGRRLRPYVNPIVVPL